MQSVFYHGKAEKRQHLRAGEGKRENSPPAKALSARARWQRDVPLAGPRNLTKIIPVPEL